jgi:ParB family chromosome partitioning protein
MRKFPLGKGLEALMPSEKTERVFMLVGIDEIVPNSSQPRKDFKEDSLEELANSIKEKGIIQPLVLRRAKGGYEIIAGERRWRAAQRAGLTRVPAIIKDVDARDALELALVENLQREDLNPIEEATAYEQLINDFGLTHEEISSRIGKDRSTITNQLRLLKLPEEAKRALVDGEITAGHARTLLSLGSHQQIRKVLDVIRKEKLSVRKTEQLVQRLSRQGTSKESRQVLSPYIDHLSEELRKTLGTQVRIVDRGGRGRIEIEYYSQDELGRLIETLIGKTI